MSENKTLYKFYLDPDTLETLKRIKQTDGVPVAESIRRGIDMYLKQRQLVDARVVWTPGAAPTADGNE
jgi:hypothetical protein